MLKDELKKAADGLEELEEKDLEEVAGGVTNIRAIGASGNSDSEKSSIKSRVASTKANNKSVRANAAKGAAGQKAELRSDMASKAAGLSKAVKGVAAKGRNSEK